MENFFIEELNKRGYIVDESALSKIELSNSWYENKFIKGFHDAYTANGERYDLERMNFAKRLCSDDANLIEIIEINAQQNKKENDYVLEILEKNNFFKMYRKQIEQLSATGTVGVYLNVTNAELDSENNILDFGEIAIQYCDCLNIVPLTIINDEIIEVAFINRTTRNASVDKYNMILFLLDKEKNYNAEVIYFNNKGQVIKEMGEVIEFGKVKPFAILRSAENNNLKMRGYGYPKLWSAIPNLKILDLSYTMWRRDLEKSDKIVLINQKLSKRDENGNIIPPTKEMKKIFVQVGAEALPQEKALYQEYNPTVRIEDVKDSLELALSLLSMSFGYGTKKYTFENGRILTATEYVGERQDLLQEVNKQRNSNEKYIKDIICAIRWINNNFGNKIKLNENDEIKVDFDDTYVENKTERVKQLREDALTFGIDTLEKWYFMERYNLGEEEAEKLLLERPSENDGTELEE